MREIFRESVRGLQLPVRGYHTLDNAGIKTIGQLVVKTEAELLREPNFGRKTLNDVKSELKKRGLYLGMVIDNDVDMDFATELWIKFSQAIDDMIKKAVEQAIKQNMHNFKKPY